MLRQTPSLSIHELLARYAAIYAKIWSSTSLVVVLKVACLFYMIECGFIDMRWNLKSTLHALLLDNWAPTNQPSQLRSRWPVGSHSGFVTNLFSPSEEVMEERVNFLVSAKWLFCPRNTQITLGFATHSLAINMQKSSDAKWQSPAWYLQRKNDELNSHHRYFLQFFFYYAWTELQKSLNLARNLNLSDDKEVMNWSLFLVWFGYGNHRCCKHVFGAKRLENRSTRQVETCPFRGEPMDENHCFSGLENYRSFGLYMQTYAAVFLVFQWDVYCPEIFTSSADFLLLCCCVVNPTVWESRDNYDFPIFI